jgi:hypothetical protein
MFVHNLTPKYRYTTLRKVRIQPPSSASAVVTCGGPLMKRVRVWWAGECEGSGKVFFHRSTVEDLLAQNWTLAKRWVRVRWTHDLETTQQALSVVGLSCKWSTMRSRISGGREDIVVYPRTREVGTPVSVSVRLHGSGPGPLCASSVTYLTFEQVNILS